MLLLALAKPAVVQSQDAAVDTVLLGGKILTVDPENHIVSALAIGNGRIVAVGTDQEIRGLIGERTDVVQLNGRTVIPGIIAAHCHAIGVARNALDQPHVELLTIAEVQAWVRKRARQQAAGSWIRVPRADITRLKERRHPTTRELDEACNTHPVVFTAARKSALNTLGLNTLGLNTLGVSDNGDALPGVEIVRDAEGRVRLIAGAATQLRKLMPPPTFTSEQLHESLVNVHKHYNAVGITSIFERAGSIDDFLMYRKLRADGQLTVRMTQTFRSGFRSAADVAAFAERAGMKTGDGDDWVRVGPLKITVDGGIHWGNTYLREDYGEKRIRFYVHKDPKYRGALNYTREQMTINTTM